MYIDPGDYGAVYNDVEAAADNRSIIDGIIADIESLSPVHGGGIVISGPPAKGGQTIKPKSRLAGALAIDCSTSPLTFPGAVPFDLVGMAGSLLQCVNAGSNSDHCGIKIAKTGNPDPGGALGPARLFHRLINLHVVSDGRAVWIKDHGEGVLIQSCRIKCTDKTVSPTKAALTDIDAVPITDPSDLDQPCALLIENTDGGSVQAELTGSGYHGMIVKRWHAGEGCIRVSFANGTGIKGHELRAFRGRILAESCGQYGLYLVNCRELELDNIWFENNLMWNYLTNKRAPGSKGHGYRQAKIRRCDGIVAQGHNGWKDNQFDIDDGTINAIRITQQTTPEPSDAPVHTNAKSWDLENMTQAGLDANNNHGKTLSGLPRVWQDKNFEPTITYTIDSEIHIDIPASCYNHANGRSYIFPFDEFVQPKKGHDFDTGDTVQYHIELSVDQAGADHAVRNDATSTASQNPGGGIDGRPRLMIVKFFTTGVEDVEEAMSTVHLYNTKRRKFSGNYVVESQNTVFPRMQLTLFEPGSDRLPGQQSLNPNPENAYRITIHNLKLYLRRQHVTPVP